MVWMTASVTLVLYNTCILMYISLVPAFDGVPMCAEKTGHDGKIAALASGHSRIAFFASRLRF